jgi:hypothetical protein
LAPLIERVAEPCREEVAWALLERWQGHTTLREAIALRSLKGNRKLIQSDDEALRRAFFRTFDPEADPTLMDGDWNEWLKRDPQGWLWIMDNPNVWRSPRARMRLALLPKDPFERSLVRDEEARQRDAHPEWFEAEEHDDVNIAAEAKTTIAGEVTYGPSDRARIARIQVELAIMGWFVLALLGAGVVSLVLIGLLLWRSW